MMDFKYIQMVVSFLATNKEDMPPEDMLAVAIAYSLPVPTMESPKDYYGYYVSNLATKLVTDVLCPINEERLIDIDRIKKLVEEVWHFRVGSLWAWQFDVPKVTEKMTLDDWHAIETLTQDLKVAILS